MLKKIMINQKTKLIVDLNIRPEDKKIVIGTIPGEDQEYIDMLANLINAKANIIPTVVVTPRKAGYAYSQGGPGRLPTGEAGLSETAMAAFKSADLLFLVGLGTAHATERIEIWEAGCRTVEMGHDRKVDGLSNQTVDDIFEIRKRCNIYEKLLNETRSFHLTSDAGTDLTGSIEGKLYYSLHSIAEGIANHGNAFYAETMGCPVEGTTEGVFVPDCIGGIGRVGPRIFKEPVKIIIKKGLVVDAEGGREAKMFKRMILECSDPNARNIAEMSVGTYSREKSRYTDDVEDVKLTSGAAHIAVGDNHAIGSHPKIRGKVPSILHIDAAELNATLKLDGKTVIDKGKLLY